MQNVEMIGRRYNVWHDRLRIFVLVNNMLLLGGAVQLRWRDSRDADARLLQRARYAAEHPVGTGHDDQRKG